jgi:hypothetical protein
LRRGECISSSSSVRHQLTFVIPLANVPFRPSSNDGAFRRNKIQRTRISSSSPESSSFGNGTQASGICFAS